MKLAVLVAIAALGCGAKKDENAEPQKDSASYTRLLAKSAELAERMCGCKDEQCVLERMDEFTLFVIQQKKLIADKPTGDFEARMHAIENHLKACMDKALKPPARVMPAVPKEPLRVAALVQAARTRATELDKRLVLSTFIAKYVRADGTLDKQYGALALGFRMPPLKDDPGRPIGAPQPEPSADNAKTDCPTWTASGGKWQEELGACAPRDELAPKCTLEQVWARAIADKAPDTALATLELEIEDGKPTWTFAIQDRARSIEIRKEYPDDCAVQVEKPKP